MRRTLVLGVLSGSSVLMQFAMQWYVLITIGPGVDTDALFAGMTIPQLILAVVSTSLFHVLVPILSIGDDEARRSNAWSFFVAVGLLFGVLALVLAATAPAWVKVLLPGFDAHGLALTTTMTCIQLIGMLASAFNAVLWATLSARGRFVQIEVTGVIASGISLVVLFLALPVFGVYAAAWAMTLRFALITVLLCPALGRIQWPVFMTAEMRLAGRRMAPLLLGSGYYSTGPLVDRLLASMAGPGDLSLLNTAQLMYGAGQHVIGKAAISPIVPRLSRCYAEDRWSEYREILRQTYWLVSLFLLACYVFLIIYGDTILGLIFGGGFSPDQLAHLRLLLLSLLGFWVGGVLGQVASSSFYARGNTATPTLIGVVGYTIGIPLKLLGFYFFGVTGLALGISVSYFITVAWLFVSSTKTIPGAAAAVVSANESRREQRRSKR